MINRYIVPLVLGFSFVGSVSPAFAQTQPAKTTNTAKTVPGKKGKSATDQAAEPDKALYDRGMLDFKKGRYTEGRLSLQTLINTYPDSEYLAKAKLGVADSYFKEGGTSSMTEAVGEYKDFITFFPFLDEASYAAMQIGMAHYRMMEKADRDRTQALEAEEAFQTFLTQYPQSSLLPKAEQHLRDVQEILADGQYKIARFYYVKQDFRPAAARLVELTEHYPLYSQSDEALWMLGDVYARAKQASKSEDDQNHWADLASQCYSRIIQDYPLSRLTPDAKARLTAMGMKVPAPDPSAAARMQQQQLYERQHHNRVQIATSMFRTNPSYSSAAHSGAPTLTLLDDEVSAIDVLKPGASGPTFDLVARPVAADANAPAPSGDITPAQSVGSEGGPSGSTVGAEIIAAPASASDAAQPAPVTTAPAAVPAEPAPSQLPAPLTPTSSASATAAPAAATVDSAPNQLPAPLTPTGASPASNSATENPADTPDLSIHQPTVGNNGQEAEEQEPAKANPDTESTSKKKKKGLHKLNPF